MMMMVVASVSFVDTSTTVVGIVYVQQCPLFLVSLGYVWGLCSLLEGV